MSDSTDTVSLPVATQTKTSFCIGCPAEAKGCVLKGRWVPDARMTVLVEAPTWPNLNTGSPFTDQNGKLLKKLITALEQKVGRDLPVNVAYASGAMGKPSAEVLAHCAELWKSQWSTHFGQQTGPHVIVPFGLPAAKGVGLSGKKILDIRGRMQQRVIGTRPVFVIPTLSLNALYTKPGLAEVVQQDLLRAAKTAYLDEYVPPKTIEELSKGYVFPKTIEEVKKVCDDVIAYFDPEKQNSQWDWPIAVDIETNTLKAFRRDAKVLMISFGWDDGKATAILLNHPENKFYDPALAWAEVRRVLECAKPKVFHNCLTGDSLVTLPDGSKRRLDNLVKTRYAGDVLTVNELTGVVEPKRVIDWVKGPVARWDAWKKIRVRGKGELRLTNNHEVITERGRVRADQLVVGDQVLRGTPGLNEAQQALVYGSMAGDASLTCATKAQARAPYFSVSHCAAQFDYLKLKERVLDGWVSSVTASRRTGGFSKDTGTEMHTLRTRSDAEFHEVWDACTHNGKKQMSESWWQHMSDPALAIWYCDDGSLQGAGAAICVSAIGGDIACRGLLAQGYPAKLTTRPDGQVYLRINGPRGRGMAPGLKKFWDAIAPYVPRAMAYKLPSSHRHLASDAYWTAVYPVVAASDTVVSIEPLARTDGDTRRHGGMSTKGRRGLPQYCLTVEGNHNFIASGLAVSNCKFDLQFLERVAGVRVHNVTWDTMCGQHWISEDQKGVYGLKALAPSYAPEYEGYEERLHEALRHGEEAAPTEEDVLKEAKELAATTAETGDADTSWLEGAEDLEEDQADEEDETPPNNDRWLAEPEWLDGTKDEDKAEYRTHRDAWFALDQAGKGKERGQELRKWKKWAKLLSLPEPDPIPVKELKKALSEWEAVAIETIMPYAAADADVTRIVFKKQWRRLRMLDVSDDAKRVMDDLYLPGARALGALEFRGAKVNLDLAAAYDTQLTDMIVDESNRIQNLAMRHFKINAPKQLGEVLLSLGFRSLGSTKGGQMKTGKDVLVAYQKECVDRLGARGITEADKAVENRRLEFVESLLLYKAATKMKSSFLKRLREYSGLDGHIHTTFHLTGTSTGRLSSSKLNLQNLPLFMCRITRPNPADPENPVVIHEGFNVKALLVPEDDSEVFWNLDIKAAEIRVAAYYSGDEALIDALNNGLDIHTFFLTKIKHPDLEGEELQAQYKAYLKAIKVDHDPELDKFRTAVKRVVFGTLYGAGPRKIAAQIGNGFTDAQAKELIAGLFKAFPGLKDYIDATKSEINARSRTKTVFGRYRRFLLAGVNNELKSKAEREGVNFRIQSTSSDLVLSQLCEINQHLDEIEAVMRLTVHDSMAGTVKKSRVHEMKAFFDYWLVQRVRERFPWMPVPFEYDLEIGPNYGEKDKYQQWVKANPPAAAAA